MCVGDTRDLLRLFSAVRETVWDKVFVFDLAPCVNDLVMRFDREDLVCVGVELTVAPTENVCVGVPPLNVTSVDSEPTVRVAVTVRDMCKERDDSVIVLVLVTSDVRPERVFRMLLDDVCTEEKDLDCEGFVPVTVTNGVGDLDIFAERLVADTVLVPDCSILCEGVPVFVRVAVLDSVSVCRLRVKDLSFVGVRVSVTVRRECDLEILIVAVSVSVLDGVRSLVLLFVNEALLGVTDLACVKVFVCDPEAETVRCFVCVFVKRLDADVRVSERV